MRVAFAEVKNTIKKALLNLGLTEEQAKSVRRSIQSPVQMA